MIDGRAEMVFAPLSEGLWGSVWAHTSETYLLYLEYEPTAGRGIGDSRLKKTRIEQKQKLQELFVQVWLHLEVCTPVGVSRAHTFESFCGSDVVVGSQMERLVSVFANSGHLSSWTGFLVLKVLTRSRSISFSQPGQNHAVDERATTPEVVWFIHEDWSE